MNNTSNNNCNNNNKLLYNMNTGKINVDKLMQTMYSSGIHFSTKQFMKIFNNKI